MVLHGVSKNFIIIRRTQNNAIPEVVIDRIISNNVIITGGLHVNTAQGVVVDGITGNNIIFTEIQLYAICAIKHCTIR